MDNITAWKIHRTIRNEGSPIPAKVIAAAVEQGMLPLKDLKPDAVYLGWARNTQVARWNARDKKFYYIREKFDQFRLDTVDHPEAEFGFDVFVPVKLVAEEVTGQQASKWYKDLPR